MPLAGIGGEVVISRSEMVVSVTTGSTANVGGAFILDAINFSWLANLAKAFERLRWLSLAIEWRPAVGTTTDGTIALGVDWGSSSADTLQLRRGLWGLHASVDRKEVLACTPNSDSPLWQPVKMMQLPVSRLQSRDWYEIPVNTSTKVAVYDRAPGSVVYYATAGASKTCGEIWVHYTVLMSGTRSV